MFRKKNSPEEDRAKMIEKQLVKRHIKDQRVLQAMANIPRHRFVDDNQQSSAYNDGPLPIGYGQTISQPFIVAYMSQALELPPNGESSVLEIGTGSGYQTAILSQLAGKVYSIERIDALARRAYTLLDELDIKNVKIKVGDGGYGWPDYAPYDAIIVTAAAPEIPAPLKAQLKDGANLIVPVGPRGQQDLICIQRQGDKLVQKTLAPVAFVPLLGEHGWGE